MSFCVNDCEKKVIKYFKELKYPNIYKQDLTDNILFIELVDFDVCSLLLKGKLIKRDQYNEIMEAYRKYLSHINIAFFDEYALMHYKELVRIMEIFKKYYAE